MAVFITALLVAMLSVTSCLGKKLKLSASNPSVVFQTANHPKAHKARDYSWWLVSAPGNVNQLEVTCFVDILKSPNCFKASFMFYDYDEPIAVCGRQKISRTLNGSTYMFEFKSSMCVNFSYRGVSCVISYNPDEIPTCTSPINPNCTCGEKRGPRILRGKKTKPNEYPWQALLIHRYSRLPFCGGSVIAKQWVLSANHCVMNDTRSSILVVLGEHDYKKISSRRQCFNVIKIIKHENYMHAVKHINDIALLKLVQPVDFDDVISPICLPFNYKYYDFTDQIGITTGWGLTIPGNNRSGSRVLKKINQKIIMPSKCSWLDGYEWFRRQITENMMCALAKKGSPYDGDSGGPMVWKSNFSNLYFQLGVTSFGEKYLIPNEPTVYARVSKFVDWIVAKTGVGDEFCVKI